MMDIASLSPTIQPRSDTTPRPIPTYLLHVALRVVDVGVLVLAGLATIAYFARWRSGAPAGEQALAMIIATAVAACLYHRFDVYAPQRLTDFRYRSGRMILGVAVGGMAAFASLVLMPMPRPETAFWPALWVLCAATLSAATALLTARLARLPGNIARLAQRVAVVGADDYARDLASRLAADPATSVATVVDGLWIDSVVKTSGALPEFAMSERIENLLAGCRLGHIDAIVISLPQFDSNSVLRARLALRGVTTDVYIAGCLVETLAWNGRLDRLGGIPVIKIGTRPLTDVQMLQKALVDWVLSTTILITVLPALALIATAIRLDSPGPVLFRQPRLGFNNTMFVMFKFRTIYHHMTDLTANKQIVRNDPRVTRVGRWLRRTSLDELPQLLNVLRGEMSLVGPRPHAPNTKAGNVLFHEAVPEYAWRHRVKPGITGWAQVNGWRGETSTRTQLEQRVAHDLHYINNWSLRLDLRIIVLTILREFGSGVAF